MYSYRIEQAIRAAAILHKEQIRKGPSPVPYITHLSAVAWLARDYSNSEEVIVAAWLHDTLEDTDYTAEELEEDFGYEVRLIVESLSEPKTKADKKLDWKERKEAYGEQLKEASEEALIVAAADKIHNMRCWVEDYHDRPARFVKDFGGSLSDRAMQYQNMSNILNRRLGNDILAEFNHVYSEYKNFLIKVEQHVEKNKKQK